MADDMRHQRLLGARGYLSYSHDDHESVGRLSRELFPKARTELGIEFWSDAAITTESRWSDVMANAIAKSDIFVLCMSAHYLASEYLYRVELPAIRARAQSTGALVIPVILSHCAWWGFVGDVAVLPVRRGRVVPILEWRPGEKGYQEAASQIVDDIRDNYGNSPDRVEPWRLAGKDNVRRMIQAAPPGHHKVPPREIDRAVRAVLAKRAAGSDA